MQKLLHKKRFVIVLCAIVCIAVVVAAGIFLQRDGRNAGLSGALTSTKLQNIPAGVDVVAVSGSIVGYSFSELIERSQLVVYGKITAISDAFTVAGVSGGMCNMMDVTVEPVQVLRGNAEKTVTLRVMGGLVSDTYEDYSEMPELNLGEEWLFMLYKPNSGGGMNTEGDYYYLTGLYQGAFKAADTAEIKTRNEKVSVSEEDKVFVNVAVAEKLHAGKEAEFDMPQTASDLKKDMEPTGTVIALSAFEAMMPDFNSIHPIDPDLTRKESLAAYEGNLETGFITQEEHDRWVADLDKYARILTDEDLQATPDPRIEAEKDVLRKALAE